MSDIRAVQVKLDTDFSGVRTHHGDFADGDLADELLAADAPDVVARAFVEHARDRRGLLFAPTVAAAEAFSDALVARGIRSEWLSGETPKDERRDTLARLRTGETRVVSNCAVLIEGFDEPGIDVIVMARPTKSRPLYVQCVGRGTRKYPGKDDLLVLDLAGTAARHSLISTATLFGLTPGEVGKSGVLGALQTRRDQTEREPWTGDPWAAQAAMVSQAVNVFRQRPMHWNRAGDVFVLPIPNGRLLLRPSGDRFAVVEQLYGSGLRVLFDRLPVEYAMGAAEDRVRQLGAAHLADPHAPWRNEPASPKQRDVLIRFRRWRPGLTKGKASDLISMGRA